MGNFVFNIAKGRVNELYNRVDTDDPTNAVLVIVAINTTETDTNLKRLDDLAAVLANVNTAEVTNTNYTRKILDDTVTVALVPDDVNDWLSIDIPDQVFNTILAGDAWTDLLLCYDSDNLGGTDANILPLGQFDFPITPDGSDITAVINASGLFRAT
jgi:hypothetical protein